MSEDKTEIPGNEEPTEGMEPSKAPTTNMMIETLLLELKKGFARMDSRFDALENACIQLKESLMSSQLN